MSLICRIVHVCRGMIAAFGALSLTSFTPWQTLRLASFKSNESVVARGAVSTYTLYISLIHLLMCGLGPVKTCCTAAIHVTVTSSLGLMWTLHVWLHSLTSSWHLWSHRASMNPYQLDLKFSIKIPKICCAVFCTSCKLQSLTNLIL